MSKEPHQINAAQAPVCAGVDHKQENACWRAGEVQSVSVSDRAGVAKKKAVQPIVSKPTSNVDEDRVQVNGSEGRLQRAQERDFDMTLIRV